jgi:hypothetical protein
VLVFLSHRRLKPGSYDRYREAWEPEVVPEDILREEIYHARSLENPDEVISFGIMDISRDEIPKMREAFGGEEAEARRQARMAEVVEWTGIDAIFEVVEELRIDDREVPSQSSPSSGA